VCYFVLRFLSSVDRILQTLLPLPDVSKFRHYVLIAVIMTLKIKFLTPQLQWGQLSNL